MKKAWLIGINYIDNPDTRLKGSIMDINNIHNMLIDAYDYNVDDITLIRDDDPDTFILPTRENIIKQFEKIVEESEKLQEIWFHYSGHGSRLFDKEKKQYSEIIIPIDYEKNGVIYDYEILNYLMNVKCKILLFFDCCHSGSICDLPFKIEYNNGELISSQVNELDLKNKNIIVMSGCKDEQTSIDTLNKLNENMGAFTNALIECLHNSHHKIDIISLYKNICTYLESEYYKQLPILSSSMGSPEYNFTHCYAS